MMSQFSQFVKSLYRLYRANKVDKDYIVKLLIDNKLSQEEYNYIVGE